MQTVSRERKIARVRAAMPALRRAAQRAKIAVDPRLEDLVSGSNTVDLQEVWMAATAEAMDAHHRGDAVADFAYSAMAAAAALDAEGALYAAVACAVADARATAKARVAAEAAPEDDEAAGFMVTRASWLAEDVEKKAQKVEMATT